MSMARMGIHTRAGVLANIKLTRNRFAYFLPAEIIHD